MIRENLRSVGSKTRKMAFWRFRRPPTGGLFAGAMAFLLLVGVGCGGGGGGGNIVSPPDEDETEVETVEVSGNLDLEDLPDGDYTVGSFWGGEQPVANEGSLSQTVSSETNNVLVVGDDGDRVWAMAISSPAGGGAEDLTIDAQSTAWSLVAISPGIASSDPTQMAQVKLEMTSLPEYQEFADLVSEVYGTQDLGTILARADVNEALSSCLSAWQDSFIPDEPSADGDKRFPGDDGLMDSFRIETEDGNDPANTRVTLKNFGWRYVKVFRELQDLNGNRISLTEIDAGPLLLPTHSMVGANTLSWGRLLSSLVTGNPVYTPGVYEDTFDASYGTDIDQVEYYSFGLGLQELPEDIPVDLADVNLTDTYFITIVQYVVIPVLDIFLGLSDLYDWAESSEILEVVGEIWTAVGDELAVGGLIETIAGGDIDEVMGAVIELVVDNILPHVIHAGVNSGDDFLRIGQSRWASASSVLTSGSVGITIGNLVNFSIFVGLSSSAEIDYEFPVDNDVTLQVNTSPDDLEPGWVITGPDQYMESGEGFGLLDGPPGVYTITWEEIPGYDTPPDEETSFLEYGDFHIFEGDYSPDVIPPNRIEDLHAPDVGGSNVTLTWTAPGDDGGLGTAALYEMRMSSSSLNESNFDSGSPVSGLPVPAAAGTPEEFVLDGLSPSTTYHFAIRAADDAGNIGPVSPDLEVTTGAMGDAPPDPIDLTGMAFGPYHVALSWIATGDDGSTGYASAYNLRYSTSIINSETAWSDATEISQDWVPSWAGTQEETEVWNLDENTTYFFAIRAQDSSGQWSALGGNAELTTPSCSSDYICGLQVTESTAGSLTLSWEGSAYFEEYRVMYSTDPISYVNHDEAAFNVVQSAGGGTQTHILSGLIQETEYFIQIRGFGSNNSTLSRQISAFTSGSVSLDPVSDLVVSQSSTSAMSLLWTAPNAGGGPAAIYDIRYSLAAISEDNWEQAQQANNEPTPDSPGNTDQYVLFGLDAGTEYFVALKYADAQENWSALSNVAVGATADPEAPATITDLETGTTGADYVTLTWTAPEHISGDGATLYDLRYAETAIDEDSWASATPVDISQFPPGNAGSQEFYTATGLGADTCYWFAIKSRHEDGPWSAVSNSVQGCTTDDIPPADISDLSVTFSGTDEVSLAWTAPGDNGNSGQAAEYDLRYSEVEINSASWELAQPVTISSPLQAGEQESATVFPLEADRQYYFAIKTRDAAGNWSGLSNVVETTTETEFIDPVPMLSVEAGVFVMGSPENELGRREDETQHHVQLTQGFLVSRTEITAGLYAEVMQVAAPADCPDCPVENITWVDAVVFCNALSTQWGLDPAYQISGFSATPVPGANGYRLPTESEWEMASRAGSETALPTGDLTQAGCSPVDPVLGLLAWYCGNAGEAQPIGLKNANSLGIQDMQGNVAEWCWDGYAEDYPEGTAGDPAVNPLGADSTLRVIRGGSYNSAAADCRSAARQKLSRSDSAPGVGFRIVRNP